MNWGERTGVDVVVATMVLALVIPGGTALGYPVDGRAVGDEPRPGAVNSGVASPPNNTTGNGSAVPHVDPSRVEGNESDVSGYLAREMASSLSESIDLSREQLDRAERLVDNDSEYAEMAEKYREVSGDAGESEGHADSLVGVGVAQQAFLANVSRYRQTHRQYRQVRNGSNETRERMFAHRLSRIAVAVNESAARLNGTYRNASEVREIDVENATRTVGQVRTNVTRTQRSVWRHSLVRTRLSVQTRGDAASFTDPIGLVGELRTANGTPVSGADVTVLIGNNTVNATTDRNGSFRVTYRPTLVSTDRRRHTVRFRPEVASPYARSSATVRFGIRQVTPNVTVTNVTTTVGFDDSLTVNGTVSAGGVGAPRVPVEVTVSGVRLDNATTGPDGDFGVEARLPSNVSTGEQQVVVRVRLSDRALSSAATASPVTVEPTATSVSIANTSLLGRSVFVSGRLTTADGEPVPNQTVVLRAAGETLARVATNATGSYATTVALPSGVQDGVVRVTATYPAGGTNLRPSRETATVTFGTTDGWLTDTRVFLTAVGAVGIAVLGVVVLRVRGIGTTFARWTSDDGDDGQTGQSATVPERSSDTLYEEAAASLDRDEFDRAVVVAYAAVRRRLDADADPPERATHWEFFDAYRDAGPPAERLRRLERLTECFERAAFASEPVAPADAREAVSLASAFRSETDSQDLDAGK